MRLSGLAARFGPSPFTTAPCSVSRSGMRHSSCAPMSRLAAVTMRERSVVSSIPELSNDSRANGTRNCPTVPVHRWCVNRTKRSVIDTVSGDAGGVAGAPVVRISTWARYEAHAVSDPSRANRAELGRTPSPRQVGKPFGGRGGLGRARRAPPAGPAGGGGDPLGPEHALHGGGGVEEGGVAPAPRLPRRSDRPGAIDRVEEA